MLHAHELLLDLTVSLVHEVSKQPVIDLVVNREGETKVDYGL